MYSRYSTNDWDQSNNAYYNLSERERSFAERLRADAWRAVKATDMRTRNRQASNTKRLGMMIFKVIFFHSPVSSFAIRASHVLAKTF